MADNTEENKSTEGGAGSAPDEAGMSPDQSFAYWLTMLPFLAIAGMFVYEFSKSTGDYMKLGSAAGALIVGIFVASLVNAFTQGSDNNPDDSGVNEAPKAS